MALPVPDWRLPAGVTRGLWDYVRDSAVAQNYDQALSGSALFNADQRFAEQIFERHGRPIDLGCGTGRVLISFARRGFWVLGVDLSEAMLKRKNQGWWRFSLRALAGLVGIGDTSCYGSIPLLAGMWNECSKFTALRGGQR